MHFRRHGDVIYRCSTLHMPRMYYEREDLPLRSRSQEIAFAFACLDIFSLNQIFLKPFILNSVYRRDNNMKF